MPADSTVAAIAAAFPALARLPEPLGARLAADVVTRNVPAGTRLFEPGGPCAAYPLILEGVVRVAKQAANGREILLYRIGRGESCVLSSDCLLGGRAYDAGAVAETPLVLALVPRSLFEALVAGHPPFREAVFGLLAERLADLMLLVEEVAFRRLDARLAGLLLERGPEVRATHQALAADLGSVREIVSRLLADFAERRLVVLGRERIQVVDVAGLAALAESGL